MDRQALIDRLLDHYDQPRHHGSLPDADVVQPGGIPDCGDTLTIYLKVDPATQKVAGLSFEGRGCTISQAAASLLAEQLQDAPLVAIEAISDAQMIDLVGREVAQARPRCATLALYTLQAALFAYRRSRRDLEEHSL
jgi:nitrogen fixation NifU-like protein